jgi:uncharacterized protein YodC (DUF2158 family)
MAKFAIGDIVQLKSGGPKMTVTEVFDAPVKTVTYNTAWFAGSKQERGHFPEEALVQAQNVNEK